MEEVTHLKINATAVTHRACKMLKGKDLAIIITIKIFHNFKWHIYICQTYIYRTNACKWHKELS